MNKKINSALAIGIIIIIALVFGAAIWYDQFKLANNPAENQYAKPGPQGNLGKAEEGNGTACTMEAKQCPDGSYVSRTGPNCEFTPCPGIANNNIVGNDRDEHGCIGSAGYTWCEEKQKCLRVWEESCVDTSNWETYKNTQYGFEFQYPSDWYLYADDPSDIFIQKDKEDLGSVPGPHANALEIKINKVNVGETLEKASEKLKQPDIKYQQSDYTISGIKGMKLVSVCEGVGCGAPEWIVIKNDNLYYFNSNLGYSNYFDQIITSFKFIE